MSNSINIQSNRKEIEIVRDGKSAGCIYFDPADTAIIERLKQAQAKLESIEIKTSEDFDEMLEQARVADKAIRDAVDFAFDYPCSDIVFGNSYAFSTKAGVSQFEQFLTGAMKIIEKEMKTEAAASQKRQDKYLAKYAK